MEFKDKLIENLQNELDELMERRRRTFQNNLELIDKALSIVDIPFRLYLI